MTPSEDEIPKVLLALESYVDDIVLIGGWVPELYRRFGGFSEWRGFPSRTREADILIPSPLERGERMPLEQILRAEGLRPREQKELSAVWVRPETDATEVEILTPRVGAFERTPKHVFGHGAVGAIPLDDVSVQMRHTVVLQATVASRPCRVRVPTLGAYLVARPLSVRHRSSAHAQDARDKASKDLVYIHDVLSAGAEVVSRVRQDITTIAIDERSKTEYERSRETLAAVAARKSPGLIEAAALTITARDRRRIETAESAIAESLAMLVEMMRNVAGDALTGR